MIPQLSIIIPAYNVEAFLPQCLDSIFSQKDVDVEVLCIDDGSTDGTPRLLQDYAAEHHNLRVLTQPNQGMSTARNWGLKEAEGTYVMFVDSDDWLLEGSLAKLLASLNGEDVICFNAKKYLEKTNEYRRVCSCLPSGCAWQPSEWHRSRSRGGAGSAGLRWP